jgi:spore maturation protein CgeB
MNLHQPLIKMGHDVVLLDFYYDDFFVHAENYLWLKENRKRFTQKLLQTFHAENKKKRFDFCFFYLCDGFIDIEAINEIQANGIPVINYSCNNIHQFHLVEKISTQVDIAIYTERAAKASFDSIKSNAFHMQMAANPDMYYPRNTPMQYDVTFIGQRYADRGYAVTKLIENGVDIKAFGPRWDANGEKVGNHTFFEKIDKITSIIKREGIFSGTKAIVSKFSEKKKMLAENHILKDHVGPILEDDEMIDLFSKSKINLGFSNVFQNGRDAAKVMSHVRLRDFEIPMCGAFYLTGHTEEIEEYFEIGKEIETYLNMDDLVEKCKFYIKNQSKRTSIAKNAYLRSLNSHTWEKRFSDFFSKIQFD